MGSHPTLQWRQGWESQRVQLEVSSARLPKFHWFAWLPMDGTCNIVHVFERASIKGQMLSLWRPPSGVSAYKFFHCFSMIALVTWRASRPQNCRPLFPKGSLQEKVGKENWGVGIPSLPGKWPLKCCKTLYFCWMLISWLWSLEISLHFNLAFCMLLVLHSSCRSVLLCKTSYFCQNALIVCHVISTLFRHDGL